MVVFSGILGTGQAQDQNMIKDKLIDRKKIVSRFKGKLIKMIRDAGSKFDDYSISLIWCYELTEKDFFNELTN